eukprot:3352171-Amphidinium_carterae.1
MASLRQVEAESARRMILLIHASLHSHEEHATVDGAGANLCLSKKCKAGVLSADDAQAPVPSPQLNEVVAAEWQELSAFCAS